MIRENDRRTKIRQFVHVPFFVIYAPERKIKAAFLEGVFHQRRVARLILDHQNAQLFFDILGRVGKTGPVRGVVKESFAFRVCSPPLPTLPSPTRSPSQFFQSNSAINGAAVLAPASTVS